MKIMRINFKLQPRARCQAMTLVEILMATGIGSLVLSAVMALSLYGSRSFVAMGNYVELDRYSRNAIDNMSQEIRQATALVSFSTNMPKRLTFTVPKDTGNYTVAYRWVSDSSGSKIVRTQDGNSTDLLIGCDRWDFRLCQRNPIPNTTNEFYPATNLSGVLDPKICKLIDMTWKCSRTILDKKVNTEIMQTTQIVLRNQKAN